jgi:hypothetical protein|tara:strand:- start:1219 stop:1665 length:447 start_codon:yes stop_codon:yes gene_type:complete
MLGFGSFSEFPWATSGIDNSVVITVNGNDIAVGIGNVNITANSIVQIADPDPILLKSGTPVVSGEANLTVNGNALGLGSGTVVVTGDAVVSITGNTLNLTTTSVTITGDANISPTGSSIVVKTGVGSAITWSNIDPNTNSVWKEIIPY